MPAKPIATMRSVLYYGPRDLRLMRTEVPKPGPGEALMKIEAALTCGTDFKAFRRGHPRMLTKTPSPFGHEMAGAIIEVGPGVKDVKPGMRVVAANSAPCGQCFYCLREETELCDHLELLNGAYADYVILPPRIVEKNTHCLPASLGFADAALAEPLACAMHAAHKLELVEGETVAVIGAGTMARLLILALKEAGARVIVLGRNAGRLAMAVEAGADETIDLSKGEDPAAVLRERTLGGRGADAVVEAVGLPETWRLAVTLVRKGGRVCLFGGCAAGTKAEVDTYRVHYEELKLFGVFHHRPLYMQRAVELLASGRIPMRLLVDGKISLEQVVPFFQKNSEDSPLKTAVLPGLSS